MPEVTPADAVRTLTEKVRAMDLDDLRDTHNELFPETPIPPIDPTSQGTGVRQKVLTYLAGGVAVEEILDLWMPSSRKRGASTTTTSPGRSITWSNRKRSSRPTDPRRAHSTSGITGKSMRSWPCRGRHSSTSRRTSHGRGPSSPTPTRFPRRPMPNGSSGATCSAAPGCSRSGRWMRTSAMPTPTSWRRRSSPRVVIQP